MELFYKILVFTSSLQFLIPNPKRSPKFQ